MGAPPRREAVPIEAAIFYVSTSRSAGGSPTCSAIPPWWFWCRPLQTGKGRISIPVQLTLP